jgi:hypothetical protein
MIQHCIHANKLSPHMDHYPTCVEAQCHIPTARCAGDWFQCATIGALRGIREFRAMKPGVAYYDIIRNVMLGPPVAKHVQLWRSRVTCAAVLVKRTIMPMHSAKAAFSFATPCACCAQRAAQDLLQSDPSNLTCELTAAVQLNGWFQAVNPLRILRR